MHFWVKVIVIDFQLEKYIPFKEKDVFNFYMLYYCHNDVTK